MIFSIIGRALLLSFQNTNEIWLSSKSQSRHMICSKNVTSVEEEKETRQTRYGSFSDSTKENTRKSNK